MTIHAGEKAGLFIRRQIPKERKVTWYFIFFVGIFLLQEDSERTPSHDQLSFSLEARNMAI